MIDRDQLREALDIVNNGSRFEDLNMWEYRDTPLEVIEQAARLVADPDTLTITKVDGEWPDWVYVGLGWELDESVDAQAVMEGLWRERPR